MAFMRYAKAMVVQPHVTQKGWGKVRKTASTPSRNLVAQASEILGTAFDPSKYLLTHCTIVASVDVEKVRQQQRRLLEPGSPSPILQDFHWCPEFLGAHSDRGAVQGSHH